MINNHKNITLLKIDSSHLNELQEISRQTFVETFAAVNTKNNINNYLNTALTIGKLTEEINNPNSEFYFAKAGKKTVGYLKINVGDAQTESTESNSLEIERIYVLKEFQGKKIGQILFEKAIEIARKNNMDLLWLGVWEHNTGAISFYQKNGLVKFASHLFRLGDDEQTDIMMKLDLKNSAID